MANCSERKAPWEARSFTELRNVALKKIDFAANSLVEYSDRNERH
jgi:hypothetical protein